MCEVGHFELTQCNGGGGGGGVMDKKLEKVFSSDIQRGQKPLQNDLRELLHVNTAKPLLKPNSDIETEKDFEFKPHTEKIYARKKKSYSVLRKVVTVRDVRSDMEKIVFEYLPYELVKKEKYLYRKICNGSVKDDTVKKILKASEPLKKNTFQMITNLNPEKKLNPVQYVFWNGKKIRVNGSTGGEKKFIVNFDLEKEKDISKAHKLQSNKNYRKNLIQGSLSVKFKPGPLSMKGKLDYSHQKYNIGPSELIKLPRIGLEVEPQVGKVLEPTISNIIHSQREENGCLTNFFAEFAVSTLKTSKLDEIDGNYTDNIVFDLNYSNNQNYVLMRRDADAVVTKFSEKILNWDIDDINMSDIEYEIELVVDSVLKNIIDAVEISLSQNDLYSESMETVEEIKSHTEEKEGVSTHAKDKVKRKYGELAKLDVTVIQINHSTKNKFTKACNEIHCKLGCICASLETDIKLKSHCGRLECMFDCTCDFSQFKNSVDAQYSELLPGIFNLDSKINSTLTKEEQKFHQTVVLTENKSIVLKSQRRSTKAPKRYYTEFMETEVVQPAPEQQKTTRRYLTIPVTKLPCRNIEPWCMVHNLYKCFCKGRFTECTLKSDLEDENNNDSDENEANSRLSSEECEIKSKKSRNELLVSSSVSESRTCARVKKYSGRRYADNYYKETNTKIKDMEENDKKLHEKLLKILNKSLTEESLCHLLDSSSSESAPENVRIAEQPNTINPEFNTTDKPEAQFQMQQLKPKHPNKAKLIAWLEANYKIYKNRLETRNKPIPLEPPKLGKIALYPWEVILDRFNQNKNYFLVTREVPYRIFMAVDLKNPFLDNCINIEDISFSEVAKYPATVKNLLQNVSYLKDNFYILCGMSHCWELIGSVTKIREKSDSESDNQSVTKGSTQLELPGMNTDILESSIEKQNIENVDYSKWFIMTVENDFTEIQFSNKGFFVKHENITKAIHVAQCSGKTVRLSSQKFSSDNNLPQFGLYAIPDAELRCVFVGPYENDESLGITTVKKKLLKEQNKTRGFWIKTKKIDDFKVIDNPMSFMPKYEPCFEEVGAAISNVDDVHHTTHDNDISIDIETIKEKTLEPEPLLPPPPPLLPVSSQAEPPKRPTKIVKLVKPIKLKKSNGFYQLAQDRVFNTISLLKPSDTVSPKTNIAFLAPGTALPHTVTPIIKETFSLSAFSDKKNLQQKPVAEIAPHVKASCSKNLSQEKKSMFILKPEEINQKLTQKVNSAQKQSLDANTNMDIEQFLSTNAVCRPPSEDVFVISDDEVEDRDGTSELLETEAVENVWIESANNNINFGCIKARRNRRKEISFEFPGFKFTDFYEEKEAFNKINQVLSRKVYIPKNLQLKWQVVEKKENLKNITLLTNEHLSRNIIISKQGMGSSKGKTFDELKTGLRELRDTMADCSGGKNLPTDTPIMVIDGATSLIGDLERKCLILEHEKESLQLEASLKKSRLLSVLLQAPEELRKDTTEKMKAFLNF